MWYQSSASSVVGSTSRARVYGKDEELEAGVIGSIAGNLCALSSSGSRVLMQKSFKTAEGLYTTLSSLACLPADDGDEAPWGVGTASLLAEPATLAIGALEASAGILPCEFALNNDTSPSSFCSSRAVCEEVLGVDLFFRTDDEGLHSFFRRKHLRWTMSIKW